MVLMSRQVARLAFLFLGTGVGWPWRSDRWFVAR